VCDLKVRVPKALARRTVREGACDSAWLMTFGTQFAQAAVDSEMGLVRVRRMLGVLAPGRVLNPKLACSQFTGGML